MVGIDFKPFDRVNRAYTMVSRKRIICIVVVVVVVLVLAAVAGVLAWYFTRDKPRDKPGDKSSGGPFKKEAVATDTKECSDIGVKILDAKGSPVDSAIAAMFCLGVINMHSSGIGGGGVMLVYNRTLKEANVLDFRETAPATTKNDTFLPGSEDIKYGGLAIAVPSEVHGQYEAWKQYGWLPWKDLVQPAIDLARKGFPISAAVADVLNDRVTVENIKADAGLRELLLDKNGNPYKKGKKITNEKYARTLEQIQKNPESFYNGGLAKNITDDMKRAGRNPGRVTENDLRNYQTEKREPLESELAGMKMYLTPPPTSGAVLGLILNILKGYKMTAKDRDGTKASVLTYHRIIEAFKFGYAWRSRLGDPRFNEDKKINQVAQQMVEQKLGDRLRSKIQDNRTHNDVSYYAQFYSDADFGTTHLAVLAPNGDAVSVTTTINHWFGCKYRSTSTGIIYNNQMADFDIPGTTPVDGVYPSEVNYPGPKKRPFSSMSPAILTDDDGVVQFIIGASGGKMITTAVSLVLMNKLWFDESLSDAVDEPRLHEQLVPEMTVEIEEKKKYRLDSKIVKGLEDRGHEVRVNKSFAVVQAVYRKPGKGIYAKSDPRKHGEPSGE